jgi:hypothetical protein
MNWLVLTAIVGVVLALGGALVLGALAMSSRLSAEEDEEELERWYADTERKWHG